MAENCWKDPAELSSFIDAVYRATINAWVLLEVDVAAMVKFCENVGALTGFGIKDRQKVLRYREKLLRSKAPPGVIATTDSGLCIINGRHTLLALNEAKRKTSLWYVQDKDRSILDAVLLEIDNESGPHDCGNVIEFNQRELG